MIQGDQIKYVRPVDMVSLETFLGPFQMCMCFIFRLGKLLIFLTNLLAVFLRLEDGKFSNLKHFQLETYLLFFI